MIDTPELEDRLRRTYAAIADGVAEPASERPWIDRDPARLVALDGDPDPARRGGRRLAAIGAASVVLVAIIVGGIVATRPPSPQLDTVAPAGTLDETSDGSTATPPTTLSQPPEGKVALTLWSAHDEPIDGGNVDLWVWDEDGSLATADGATANGPSSGSGTGWWRPLYLNVPVVAMGEERVDANGIRWSLLTFHLPPVAGQWLAIVDGMIGVTVSTSVPTCSPLDPACADHRPAPSFTLDTRAADAPTTNPIPPAATPLLVVRPVDAGAFGGEALLPGILAVDPAGCITLNGSVVRWPDGTRLEPAGAALEVVLPNGDRAPLSGEPVSISGGTFPLSSAPAPATSAIPEVCATASVIDAWTLEPDVTTVDEMPP